MSSGDSFPDISEIVSCATIRGLRLVEADVKTKVRKADQIPKDALFNLSYGATTAGGIDETGAFFVTSALTAEIGEGIENYVRLHVVFELAYQLPEGFDPGEDCLSEFAKRNGVFNTWPFFREIVQNVTARMNLPPLILPLFAMNKASGAHRNKLDTSTERTGMQSRRKEANMAKKDVHVVPRGDGWAVTRENSQRDSSHHKTQGEALDAGRATARREGTELVTHGRDGRIRDSDSYGNDPNPPKDRKH